MLMPGQEQVIESHRVLFEDRAEIPDNGVKLGVNCFLGALQLVQRDADRREVSDEQLPGEFFLAGVMALKRSLCNTGRRRDFTNCRLGDPPFHEEAHRRAIDCLPGFRAISHV
jgi:hypothetical protein